MLQQEEEKTWDAELKPKERLFVLHFCTDDLTFLNATASYKAVYKERDKKTRKIKDRSNEVCEACSSRLMSREHIKIAVAKLLRESQADLDEKNGYKLLKDLMMLADFNPAEIVKANGTLTVKDLSQLGEKAKCIKSIEPTKFGLKIELVDRSKYMQMYLRYLNLIKPEVLVEDKLKVIEMVPKSASVEEWNKLAEKDCKD